MQRWRETVADAVAAAAVAGLVSGAPSTVHALATGRSPLVASEAAGTLVTGARGGRLRRLVWAVPVHAGLSLGWSLALAAGLPHRRTVWWGAVAGSAIATLDLGLVGRRHAAIAALPVVPQVLDHVAFGLTAATALAVRRERRAAGTGQPVRTIAARRVVPAGTDVTYAFLERLENHWLLTGHFAQVLRVAGETDGVLRLRGPMGTRRTVSTRLVQRQPGRAVFGEALVGRATVASLRWTLAPDGPDTDVELRADLTRLGWADHVLLVLGGAWWVQRAFVGVLNGLARVVSESPARQTHAAARPDRARAARTRAARARRPRG